MDKFVLSEAKRQRQAHLATILMALVTAGSMVEHPDLASRRPDQPADARYEWAIDSILRQHRSHLVQGVFVCGDYTPAFVKYIQNRIPELKCAR